jgi:hypothetical protein
MELEKHVLSAIDDYNLGKPDSALMHACTAIEGTARHLYSKDTAGKSDYNKCIRTYYWIIEPMMSGCVNLEDTKWDNVEVDDGHGKSIKSPDLADIIYHIFRCSHAHSKPVPKNYQLLPAVDGYSQWLLADGMIHMPERIIWALLGVSVFSKANAGIRTSGDYYLSWGSEAPGLGIAKFVIKDWWGREDDFKGFVSKHNMPRVKLEKLGDFCKANP